MKHSENGYVVHEGCDHIFFVGFLGAGKSTLARNLGALFNRDFVDTDRMVERMAGKTVCQIFRDAGEARFRELEAQALEGLTQRKSLLVSCGGGIVERSENVDLMHSMGKIVFLDGDLSDSLRQIQHKETRPDLGGCLKETSACYNRRRPLYEAAADYTIDIRNKSFEEVACDASKLLWEEGLL